MFVGVLAAVNVPTTVSVVNQVCRNVVPPINTFISGWLTCFKPVWYDEDFGGALGLPIGRHLGVHNSSRRYSISGAEDCETLPIARQKRAANQNPVFLGLWSFSATNPQHTP